MIGDDRMIHFSGCALNEACTIVLRGASERRGGVARGLRAPLALPGGCCVPYQACRSCNVAPAPGVTCSALRAPRKHAHGSPPCPSRPPRVG